MPYAFLFKNEEKGAYETHYEANWPLFFMAPEIRLNSGLNTIADC